MKLLIPEQTSREDEEIISAAVREFAKDQISHAPTFRRIFQVDFAHDGSTGSAVVGEPYSSTGEIVVAIIAASCKLVCTLNRGVRRGQPILVGREEIIRVVDY